ncbi:hypothetical protein RGUI_2766 [Rhodovulum sp. P5]|uniref:hypothetical protein n=1 Tax=Rhodovulum sp. P5 TaxID=1564506 RepID=UPI0009C2A825|nr:hypothetical protein [Rhodovulum sp. P5]ARE40907.1 hypothetical protein RGUI_2766 [Rhodovulum sp. P5]
MAWRWKAPDGRTGDAWATQGEAIDDAIRRQVRFEPTDLHVKERDQLWSGLVRAGWRLTEE